MKIVSLTVFLALPEGTLFSKYEPCIFSGLSVKGSTMPHDFGSLSLEGPIEAHDSGEYASNCFAMSDDGASIPVDLEAFGRDGLFEDDQLFAVWEDADRQALIALLSSPPQGH